MPLWRDTWGYEMCLDLIGCNWISEIVTRVVFTRSISMLNLSEVHVLFFFPKINRKMIQTKCLNGELLFKT